MSATNDTQIVNQAIARLGAKRINNLATDTTIEAVQARTHYTQTRDALLRSHYWNFAIGRAVLPESTTAPAFGGCRYFVLPSDYLRVLEMRGDFQIEGSFLLTRRDEAEIVYVKQVTDPTKFDALFIEVLVLQLAVKLVMPLAQDKVLRQSLGQELMVALSLARLINGKESGRDSGRNSWNRARRTIKGDNY